MAEAIASLPLRAREECLLEEILHGNVPAFLRRLCPVVLAAKTGEVPVEITVFVTPDYLAVGADDDYVVWPMSPGLAQRLADRLDCILPTPRLVDAIHAAAALKLSPQPIAPSPAMVTVPVFVEHSAAIWQQRAAQLAAQPLGALVSGHKKDVVLTQRLAAVPSQVAIYGWQRPNGKPIQPLYLGHAATWVDYSHGVRLVAMQALLDGQPSRLADLLRDPALCAALSDEGPLAEVRYPLPGVDPPAAAGTVGSAVSASGPGGLLPGFSAAAFAEQICEFKAAPDVQICINAALPLSVSAGPIDVVLYALPNGNTTAQTVGRRLNPGEDWHFDIQHIGAQTRFLRSRPLQPPLVVAYLETAGRSWPAWRRSHGPAGNTIPELVDSVKRRLGERPLRLTLSGHSGGGSFVFGYLDAVERIPIEVERIVFLDSTYAYDATKGHAAKLSAWLLASTRNALCVVAYDDSVALLNGKAVVSATGGTWYRSHRLQEDLAQVFPFASQHDAQAERYSALDGRVQFILWQNPKRAILHTVLVERNGFIHSLLSGTPREGEGYTLFGPRAYSQWIAPAPK